MLTAIVRISLHHAKLVASAAALFLVVGAYMVEDVSVDIFPKVAPTQVSIITEAPGMVSEQVEQLITRQVELAVLGVQGVASEQSVSTQGISVVDVVLQPGADPDKARDALSTSLTGANSSLPEGAGPVQLAPLTSSSNNILEIGVSAAHKSPTELRDIAQWIVRPRLLATSGVSRVALYGGAVRRIEVRARSGDLADSDLGFADVIDAVRRSTSVRGAGFIDTPAQRILIDPNGQALTATDIGAGQIHVTGGAPIRVGDVSDVVESSWPRNNGALIDGKPGVLLDVGSQLGTNVVGITRNVKTSLATLQPSLSERGVTITSDVNQPAEFINGVMRRLLTYLLTGGILTAILLAVVFRDLRAALTAFVTIPLSLLVALAAIRLFGWTINIMTMGGLIVALALIADDSVLDVENIVSDLRDAEIQHSSRARAILKSSLEVREPVIYATLIIIMAVLPIVFLSNAIGALLSPLAVVIIVGCLAAIVIALTVTPALALLFLNHLTPATHPSWLRRIGDNYATRLHRLWKKPSLILLYGVIALVGTLVIATFCTIDLIPPIHDGYLVAEYEAPASTSLAAMQVYGQRITHALLQDSAIAHVLQRTGRADFGDSASRIEHGELDIELVPNLSFLNQERVQTRIKSVLASFTGISATVQPRLISLPRATGENAKVAIRIFGENLTSLDDTALKIAQVLRSIPNAGTVRAQIEGLAPVVRIDIDFQRLALYGLSSADVLNTVQTAFEGTRAAQTFKNDREMDIAVTAEENVRRDPEAVGNLLIRSSQGISAPLKYVANVYLSDGRNSIAHDNGLRRQIVTADPAGDIHSFLKNAQQEVTRRVKLPPGVYLDYTAPSDNAGPPSSLLFEAATSTFAVLALLFVLYADARASLFIFCSTIFGAVGGFIVVALMGSVLSLGTFMGFVVLFGISTRNALLLLSHIRVTLSEQQRAWSPETIFAVARERLFPIVISACVICAGITPIALNAYQAGDEIIGPMVLVILGGLVTSTLMSLFISPAAVLWLWRSTPFLPGHARLEL